ncbi:proto-oncogene Mas-like [Pleurodeles waltl]|uniref:proto-oncogene Mas-like n=1 Tax=Pleurodeles waltl TaxID=8319 RepID=UPI0037095F0A
MSLSPPPVTGENWTTLRNKTYLEMYAPKMVFSSICMVVCLFGLVGNGIVAFFLAFRIKKNNFTIYILNLTVADFMFLLCTLFLTFHITFVNVHQKALARHLDLNDVVKVVMSFVVACLFGYNTSLYLLTVISVERCLSVLYPIWYQCRRPKHQTAIVCCVTWMLSCLVTALECISCDKPMFVFEIQEYSARYSKLCRAASVFTGLLSFLIFTPLMILSSVTLLIKVKRDSRKQQPSKLYVVIVATVVLFLMFGMPIRVMLQVEYKYETFLPLIVVEVSSLLSSINSSVNPFVYWFVGRWVGGKGSFLMIFLRIFREDGHKENHQGVVTNRNKAETML